MKVPLEQNAEPGWIAGMINGLTGWFPETYVEKVESPSDNSYEKPILESRKLEYVLFNFVEFSMFSSKMNLF